MDLSSWVGRSLAAANEKAELELELARYRLITGAALDLDALRRKQREWERLPWPMPSLAELAREAIREAMARPPTLPRV
jgi:hypothetical protein